MRRAINFLRNLITSLSWGCFHAAAPMPAKGYQHCFDCAARRNYRLGETPGPWRRSAIAFQDARQIAGKVWL